MAAFVVPKGSPRFSMYRQDWERWGENALVFLGPALLVLLASFVQAVPNDWKYGAVALYVLNAVTDWLRKWLADNKK